MRENGLSLADHRSLCAIERLSKEALIQCGYLRKNALRGDEDRLRFALIESDLFRAVKACHRAVKREKLHYEERKEHESEVLAEQAIDSREAKNDNMAELSIKT